MDAAHERRRFASDYGNAIERVGRAAPADAAVIRRYVALLGRECAMWRVQAERLREADRRRLERAAAALTGRTPAPSAREVAELIVRHVEGVGDDGRR